MISGELAQLMNATLLLVLWLSLPILAVAATVGLVVGLLQAVTQIQDQSLSQTLKLVAVLVTVALLGPLLAEPLLQHTRSILDQLPSLVR